MLVLLISLYCWPRSHAATVTLPDPIYLETFDDLEEGTLPQGWSAENWGSGAGIEEDNFQHLGSPVYDDWTVVDSTRFNDAMGTYSGEALGSNDYQRVLRNRDDNLLNGEVIEQLAQGNMLFANSGYHQSGGSQILFLETSDYNLSGVSDIFLSFHSLYEQNQDSTGSLEYSINGGQSWLPILYMLDRDDIVYLEDDIIDGEETMFVEHGDWAFSPDGGFGNIYADFIEADPINMDLGPFISGRINDDPEESKRIEFFRLHEADGEQRVRFRFAKTGTDSWYWGIDNFGIYSISSLRLKELIPGDGQNDITPDVVFNAVIEEGSGAQLDQASVELKFDGETVVPSIGKDGTLTTIRFDPAGLLAPNSDHLFEFTYSDNQTPPETKIFQLNFSVKDYPILTEARVLHKEDFEGISPGELPTGWSVENFTTPLIPGEDFHDHTSDAYLNWAVISRDEIEGIMTAQAGFNRIFSQPDGLFVNDQKVDSLIDGNFIVAISAWRSGAQVQYLFTKDYDLSDATNPGLFFQSIYEQNQDSLGAVEYSIDGGETWLPVIYMLDSPDIVAGDAIATFSNAHGDVATYEDPDTGETFGGTYGAFIGAEINEELGPYLSGRINDNPVESKRIELFRLPQAAGQATVRLRFAQSGTNSYYFGIDNLTFYDLPGEEPTQIASATPGADATDFNPGGKVVIVVQDGTNTQLDASTIELRLNGERIEPTVDSNGAHTISYDPPGLLESGSTHIIHFIAKDSAGNDLVVESAFAVINYVSITLPDPIVLETFEDIEEGALPTGWSVESLGSGPSFDDNDPQHLGSNFYDNWVVVDSSRFNNGMGTYDSAENSSNAYQRVLLMRNDYAVNGALVNPLAQGKILFSNSGYHQSGGTQVQLAESPSYDLSNHDHIYVSYHSIYEQNQDSFGGVEYSIDGGNTWLPVVYMLDASDVVADGDGNVDAEQTLNAEHGDIARFVDPDTGEDSNGTYGSFIKAPISPDLASFITGRVDDNTRESKRVEFFRLSQADNQASVKFRFVHTGTDSWYFGIDNFGLYSIDITPPPSIASAPVATSRHTGTGAGFNVTAGGTGPFTHQWYQNGQPLDGATESTLVFEQVVPDNAGEYFVRITNAGGFVDSPAVSLNVLPAYDAILGVWDFASDDLAPTQGNAIMEYADGDDTKNLVSFETTDGNTIPHIGGKQAAFLRLPAFSASANGFQVTLAGSGPNGGGDYINHYSMIWDVLIPEPLNWTPFFNSSASNGNDADFYVDGSGRLGIGALGYAAEGTIEAATWYRIAFAADLGAGTVDYYVDGNPVYASTSGGLDGRFSLFSDANDGPDILLFNEPSGSYTHEMLIGSFLITDRTMNAEEIAALGGASANGIQLSSDQGIRISNLQIDGSTIQIQWEGGQGPFQVQKTSSLSEPDWQNVGQSTNETSASDTIEGATGFYRIVE